MAGRTWIIAALALFSVATSAHAQEYWLSSGGDYRRQLHYACENGDDEACWRLQQMRNRWREQHEWREQQEQGDNEQDKSALLFPTKPTKSALLGPWCAISSRCDKNESCDKAAISEAIRRLRAFRPSEQPPCSG
jgi:hypothetical protein